MRITGIALVDGNNRQLLLRNYSKKTPDLSYHQLVHAVLDVIEDNLVTAGSQAPSLTGGRDLYMGLLYALEDLAIYGYVTNSRVKIIMIVSMVEHQSSAVPSPAAPSSLPLSPSVLSSAGPVREAEIKNMFKQLHNAYFAFISNPFYSPADHGNKRPLSEAIDRLISLPSN